MRTEIEKEINTRGLTNGPRITPDDVERNIAKAEYLHHGLLTICVITLQNGFTVTGESACASPENYNKDQGESNALRFAKEKIWPLMGYALREKLFREDAGNE